MCATESHPSTSTALGGDRQGDLREHDGKSQCGGTHGRYGGGSESHSDHQIQSEVAGARVTEVGARGETR
jgi:hypothetical protein